MAEKAKSGLNLQPMSEGTRSALSNTNTNPTNNDLMSGRALINIEGRVHKKMKLNNSFHRRALMGQTHFKMHLNSQNKYQLVPLSEIKRFKGECIEIYGDELRKIVNEHLD